MTLHIRQHNFSYSIIDEVLTNLLYYPHSVRIHGSKPNHLELVCSRLDECQIYVHISSITFLFTHLSLPVCDIAYCYDLFLKPVVELRK